MRRKRNIIISGVHETRNSEAGDKIAIRRILETIGCGHRIQQIVTFDRIGRIPTNGRRTKRLLKVDFNEQSAAYEVISKAYRLREDSILCGIYINRDKTIAERLREKREKQSRLTGAGNTSSSSGGQSNGSSGTGVNNNGGRGQDQEGSQRNGDAETGDTRNNNGGRNQGNEGDQRDETATTSTGRSGNE